MRKILRWSVVTTLTVLMSFMLSFAQEQQQQPATGVQSSTGAQRMQERIASEVRHELVMIPQLSLFDNLSYKVNGSTVTLMGKVVDPVIKDTAEHAVKKIEGVETVNNQIEILPPSPNDDRIRRQAARAIFSDSSLYRYSMGTLPSLRIIVQNGHIDLEGVVDSQGDKDRANILANSVPGVFSVTNNLRVENVKESRD